MGGPATAVAIGTVATAALVYLLLDVFLLLFLGIVVGSCAPALACDALPLGRSEGARGTDTAVIPPSVSRRRT